MRWSLAALVLGAAPPGQAQLRADAAVAVAADGSLETAFRASELEEASDPGATQWKAWKDDQTAKDNATYTKWKPKYLGCLRNVTMTGTPAAGRIAAKKFSKKAIFDFYSCKNFCGTHAGVGDMIGLSGMHECYCLQHDWLPPRFSGMFDHTKGVYENPVLDHGDWEKLGTLGAADACDACTTQTMSGCMLPDVQLPCPSSCDGECDCETCYGADHNFGKGYKEYCDKNCNHEGTRKCGLRETTNPTGLIVIPNKIAIYAVEKEVANVKIPPKEKNDCLLNAIACSHHKQDIVAHDDVDTGVADWMQDLQDAHNGKDVSAEQAKEAAGADGPPADAPPQITQQTT